MMKETTRLMTLTAVSLIIAVSVLSFPALGQSSGVVKVGEPLHLYIRRQPVQDDTYLHFYPPDDTLIGNNQSYRKTLQQRGNAGDSFLMFYPQARQSNFLQFEPNITLKFTYNFSILAQNPSLPVASNIIFRIRVSLKLDYDHDGVYDRDLSFEISGPTSNEIQVFEGTVPVKVGDLEKFQGSTGGRIKVNISREDSMASTVIVYCGTDGHYSWFQLPYSKYEYKGEDVTNPSGPYIYVFIGIIVVVGIVVAVLVFRDTKNKKEKEKERLEEEERSKKRRRRRR